MGLRYVTMPKWGIEMAQGTLTEWHVSEGDTITKGQLIALVETDKITNEMEADEPGVMHKILVPEGEIKIVGELLAVIGDAEDSASSIEAFISKFKAADTSMAAGGGNPVSEAEPDVASEKPAELTKSDYDDVNISPAARNLAINLSIPARSLSGTGRRGRISLQDVQQAAIAAGITSDGEPAQSSDYSNEPVIEELSNLRKTAARRLTEAKATIPHFYLRTEVNLDAMMQFKRAQEVDNGLKLSVNDLLVKAAALALIECPDVNVQMHGNKVHKFPNADISVAVATDNGLVTPLVRSANKRTLKDISAAIRDLAQRARSGKLTHEDMAAGTFTISNLGMFGIDQFDAIINPPQCAILAVGGSKKAWIDNGNGGAFASILSLSLSCDHRAIDGATGAVFLKSLKTAIENPQNLL